MFFIFLFYFVCIFVLYSALIWISGVKFDKLFNGQNTTVYLIFRKNLDWIWLLKSIDDYT